MDDSDSSSDSEDLGYVCESSHFDRLNNNGNNNTNISNLAYSSMRIRGYIQDSSNNNNNNNNGMTYSVTSRNSTRQVPMFMILQLKWVFNTIFRRMEESREKERKDRSWKREIKRWIERKWHRQKEKERWGEKESEREGDLHHIIQCFLWMLG